MSILTEGGSSFPRCLRLYLPLSCKDVEPKKEEKMMRHKTCRGLYVAPSLGNIHAKDVVIC